MRKNFTKLPQILFALSDLVLIYTCLFICYQLFERFYANFDNIVTIENLLFSTAIWLLSTRIFNLYSNYTIRKYRRVVRSTWRSMVFFIVVYCSIGLLFNIQLPSVAFFIALIFSFTGSRVLYISLERVVIKYLDPQSPANLLAIASIGGHWVQLLRLMPLFETNEVTFLSTKASLNNMVANHKFQVVPDANRHNKIKLIQSCFSIFRLIIVLKPQVIITTGAAPGLFGIMVGRILGAKTIWIDSIANVEKLSLSGRIALSVADRVYTQWDHLATSRVVFAGNILAG